MTAALALGACGGGEVATDSATPGATPGANDAPVWQAVPNVNFTLGVPSSFSIASYVSDPNGDALTIVMDPAALPPGVSYDAPNKRFVYDGVGAVGTISGIVLTADDGQA